MANRVLRYDKGIVSVPGPQGEQGEIGPIGPQGPKGDTGDRGPAGPAGAAGARGDTGLRGEPGVTGPAGATGATGPRGEQGLRGFDGPTGPAGPKGDTGPAGAASTVPGPQGPKGDTGQQGPAGTPGVPGQPGDSVADARINDEGILVIELTNGYTIDAGFVGGEGGSGVPGQDGEDGVSVDYAAINASGHLILTLSDGRTLDAGVAKGADGATGPKGDTGDKGDTGPAGAASTVAGPQGPKGETGDVGPAGPAGADAVVDYDLIRQIVAEMIEEANNGGGGTDPEPEEPEVPVDPSGMTTVRWTPNGVVSPIPASVSGWNAGAIAGDLAPTANGATLILDRDSFIDFGTVAFNLPETSNYLTTQVPSVLRMAFKGVLSAEAGRVFDFTHWANCDFKFSVPWMADRLVLGYHRGAEGQQEVGEDLNCIADFKLGENHLYEIIWTNDAAGAGGNARFYIDGVQTGPTVASAYKLRASNNMLMNCNASMGNTSDGRRLEVEYLEIGFKA